MANALGSGGGGGDASVAAGAAARARTACWLGVTSSTLLAVVVGVLVATVGRRRIPALIAVDRAVVDTAAGAMPAAACAIVGFAVLMPCLKVMEGAGRQCVGTALTFAGYYAVGFPLALALAFYWDVGLAGIWIGNACALCSAGVASLLYLARLDWRAEVELCHYRLTQQGID